MRLSEQDIKNRILDKLNDEIGAQGMYGQTPTAGAEISLSVGSLKRSLGETKAKKKKKDGETDESTGSGSAGGFSQPLFSTTKKEVEEITKVEATEATGSASSGSYSTPAAWAKSTKKNDWRGKSKTQIPGGKFVQVKKKCKKFPYCNQGDMGALKLSNENVSDRVVKTLSEKYNLSENVIRTILSNHLNKNK
jgi:hypothetical protein